MRGSQRPDMGTGGLGELIDRYPVTFGVLGANLVLFLFALSKSQGTGGAISPLVQLQLGANHYSLVFSEPWRLITCAFLHYGVIHFAFNGIALFIVSVAIDMIEMDINCATRPVH